MTTAVTPGLGWPASDRYPGGPDVPSAPSALGWPAPRPPAPRQPSEPSTEPGPHATDAATEEAPEAAQPTTEIAPAAAESTRAASTDPAERTEDTDQPADGTQPAEPAAPSPAAGPEPQSAAPTPDTAVPTPDTAAPQRTGVAETALLGETAPTAEDPPEAGNQAAKSAEHSASITAPVADSPGQAAGPAETTPVPTDPGSEVETGTAAVAVDPTGEQVDGNASAAYRESLVRDAMARVASPNPPPDVSRETWHDAAAAGHTVPDVSRETEAGGESELAAFIGEDTPIAAAAAAAIRTTRSEPFPKPARPRVLTVANQKGGVGKTTTTVNIAAGLALRGLEVLVIDLDPQGNASTALGIAHTEGTPSVYDVLVADKPMGTVVHETGIPGLFCAPATVDLAGAEIELVPVVAREGRLKRALAAYGRSFDYVFIDCPPSLGLLTVNALVAANEIVIPIQCEFYALEGLGQLLRNVELIRSHLNADLWVSTILLTMYDGRTKLADQVATEVRVHFGDLVLDSAIPRSVRISEAPGYGQTVLTYDPASRGAQAYLAAAREMAERGARMTEGS